IESHAGEPGSAGSLRRGRRGNGNGQRLRTQRSNDHERTAGDGEPLAQYVVHPHRSAVGASCPIVERNNDAWSAIDTGHGVVRRPVDTHARVVEHDRRRWNRQEKCRNRNTHRSPRAAQRTKSRGGGGSDRARGGGPAATGKELAHATSTILPAASGQGGHLVIW